MREKGGSEDGSDLLRNVIRKPRMKEKDILQKGELKRNRSERYILKTKAKSESVTFLVRCCVMSLGVSPPPGSLPKKMISSL